MLLFVETSAGAHGPVHGVRNINVYSTRAFLFYSFICWNSIKWERYHLNVWSTTRCFFPSMCLWMYFVVCWTMAVGLSGGRVVVQTRRTVSGRIWIARVKWAKMNYGRNEIVSKHFYRICWSILDVTVYVATRARIVSFTVTNLEMHICKFKTMKLKEEEEEERGREKDEGRVPLIM